MGHEDGYGDRRIGNMGGGAGDRERDRGMGQRDGNRDSGSEMDRWGQEGSGAVEGCEKRMGQKGDGETGRTWNGGMVGTGTEMEIQGGWRGWRRRGTGNKGGDGEDRTGAGWSWSSGAMEGQGACGFVALSGCPWGGPINATCLAQAPGDTKELHVQHCTARAGFAHCLGNCC